MGEKSNGKTYEGREWRFNDLAIKRTERTWEVLKGLECMLKKRWGIQGRGSRAHGDGGGGYFRGLAVVLIVEST